MPIWIPLAVAAAVQTTANIIGNIHKSKVAARNTNLTIAENKRQAELAYQREQEGISKLLKYNEPSEQMKRFEAAGLNRNLIYSQGNPGNQTMIAKYSPPNLEYKYQPAFEGSSIEPLTGLPLAAQQFKNLVSQGKILKAEELIKSTVADYAKDTAEIAYQKAFNESQIIKIRRIWEEQEFLKMFEKRSDGMWYIKDGMYDTFIEMLTAKWLQPKAQYENYQSQVAYRNQQLEMLSGVLPWLQPFINFLRLLK